MALRKAIFAASQDSFAQASLLLENLAGLSISPTHLRRLAERIGTEWVDLRDRQVKDFRDRTTPCGPKAHAPATCVMLDGGRLQARAEDTKRGAHEPHWREYKAASLETLYSKIRVDDPRPEPPSRFLDKVQVGRLAAELKANRGKAPAQPASPKPTTTRRRRRPSEQSRRPRKLERTVVASCADSETFGWQVAAEVNRRGLGSAANKACVCDGQKYNWSIWEMHLRPLGFVGVLDFVHLVVYLYAAASACSGKGTEEAWLLYECWLRLAWSGQVSELLAGMSEQGERLGEPPPGSVEGDARRVVSEAIGYVRNNRQRMAYPRYRRLGLPIFSAGIESTIKRLNRRVKGSEKFWVPSGAEALLEVRAAYLSEDGRVDRYWAQPRPRSRSVGRGRLLARS